MDRCIQFTAVYSEPYPVPSESLILNSSNGYGVAVPGGMWVGSAVGELQRCRKRPSGDTHPMVHVCAGARVELEYAVAYLGMKDQRE